MHFPGTMILALGLAAQVTGQAFVNFESPQTHPVCLSADGRRLFAVNTPDARLSVFSLQDPADPVLLWELPVGLEPVSVAARTPDEVWVVNRLSDSISVVSLASRVVVATLSTGDEPADVVFAGSPVRAFVSVSGTREVLVFDPRGRNLLRRIPVSGLEPRALTVSEDGGTVWLVAHRSGNGTTILPESLAPPQPPPWKPELDPAPAVAKIVADADPRWRSKLGARLPDHDLFELDAGSMQVVRTFSALGTVLFGARVRPGTDEVWVANTEARNLLVFEPVLRGHVADNRVTRVRTGPPGEVAPFDLNPDIDYSVLPNPAAVATALAQPTDVAFDPRGERLYVAAFGTDRIGVLDPAGAVTGRIELGAAGPDPRRKRGPRALVHHPRAELLYVQNRLSHTISVVGTRERRVLRELPVGFDPTPALVRAGRGYLYDAKLSGNGTMSCATCHVDGDTDGLAWDLGDPAGRIYIGGEGNKSFVVHPMKGPMLTQTLAGLAGVEPYHWRGDNASLHDFNPAFRTLLGGTELATQDLADFVLFLRSIALPPNPNQAPDRTYPTEPPGESAQDGHRFFQSTDFGGNTPEKTCVECHTLPTGASAEIHIGRETVQYFKIPHLRNLYKRLGRRPVAGERVAGFGLLHAGDRDDVVSVLSDAKVFGRLASEPANIRMLERFLLAFDTGTAPSVGACVTAGRGDLRRPDVRRTVDLLLAQAARGNCDVVALGSLSGRARGFRFEPAAGAFVADRSGDPPRGLDELRRELDSGPGTLTFTGVPPGSGTRAGIDRDLDGVRNGDAGPREYGASSGGCAGPLALAANSPVVVGNRGFALVATGAARGSDGLLLLGARTELRVLGITLLVDPVSALALGMPAELGGAAVLALPIPAAAELAGVEVRAQAVFPSPCGSQGLAATQGLHLRIGR